MIMKFIALMNDGPITVRANLVKQIKRRRRRHHQQQQQQHDAMSRVLSLTLPRRYELFTLTNTATTSLLLSFTIILHALTILICTVNPFVVEGYSCSNRLRRYRNHHHQQWNLPIPTCIIERHSIQDVLLHNSHTTKISSSHLYMSKKLSKSDETDIDRGNSKTRVTTTSSSKINQEKDQQQQNMWNSNNMNGLIPFFASQQPPESNNYKGDKSSINNSNTDKGFWGTGGWFRRDPEKDDKQEDKPKNTIKSKKTEPKVKPKQIKTNSIDDEKKGKSSKDETTTTNSPFTKIQELFTFNFTSKSDVQLNITKTNSNSTNPLSVVQKFASNMMKFNINEYTSKPEEKWYVVFPKTRIMPGESVPVTVAGIDLLVIASIDGRSLYCIANSCPHLGTPLETGKLTRLPIESPKAITSSSPIIATTTSPSSQSEQQQASDTDMSDLVTTNNPMEMKDRIMFTETDITNILSQDGCEDCIICPLHRTAFALSSGEVRGEWCPYPPVIGAIMGTMKEPTSAAVFDVRTRGKNIEVRLNSMLKD